MIEFNTSSEVSNEIEKDLRNPKNLDKIVGLKIYTTNPKNEEILKHESYINVIAWIISFAFIAYVLNGMGADISGLLTMGGILLVYGAHSLYSGAYEIALQNAYPYVFEILSYDSQTNGMRIRLYCRALVVEFSADVNVAWIRKGGWLVMQFNNLRNFYSSIHMSKAVANSAFREIYIDDRNKEIFNTITD